MNPEDVNNLKPSPEDQERSHQADTFRIGLMNLQELMEPMFEAAKGMREELERQGWSTETAERVAGMMLMHTVNMFFVNNANQ